MNELYWIETIGNIRYFMGIFCIIVIFINLCLALFFVFHKEKREDKDYWVNTESKWTKVLFMPTLILIIVWSFIPTKQTMIKIYGIGSTIDYIKNDTKEIPDNALKALDLYLEENDLYKNK